MVLRGRICLRAIYNNDRLKRRNQRGGIDLTPFHFGEILNIFMLLLG
jgi:hypothetical protein